MLDAGEWADVAEISATPAWYSPATAPVAGISSSTGLAWASPASRSDNDARADGSKTMVESPTCSRSPGSSVLSASILADLIDVDEQRTGERKEGVYSAAMHFVMKFGTTLATAASGFTIWTRASRTRRRLVPIARRTQN